MSECVCVCVCVRARVRACACACVWVGMGLLNMQYLIICLAGAWRGAQAEEFELNSRIGAVQTAVHAALCDNLDTAAVMDALSELIKAVNLYLAKKEVRAAAAAAPACTWSCGSHCCARV